MTRRRWPLAVAVLAAAGLAAAGCGESPEDTYVSDYKLLNDRLLRIGRSVGEASLEAGSATNAKLARRVGRHASDLEDVNRDVAALDTPDDLKDESRDLTRGIDVVVRDLRRLSGAARRGDREAAAAATVALTEDANRVNDAQNKLARATGADVGPR